MTLSRIPPNMLTGTLSLSQLTTVATSTLLGRGSAGTGSLEVLTLGSSLAISSGTIDIATIGSSGTAGSSSQVPVFTYDTKGRITGNTNTTISIPASAINNATIASGSSVSGSNTGDQDLSGYLTTSATIGIAHGGTNATSQTTNALTFYNGTSITTDSYLSYNGSQVVLNVVDSYGGFHIKGRSGGEASFALQPDTVSDGSAGQWIFYTNGSQLNNQNDFAFYNSALGAPSLIMQAATGYIGIGTNNPTVALQVNGNIAASNFSGSSSGTNTGDQNLSGLVPNTTTVNGHALSANVTVTATDIGLGNVQNTALSTWAGTSSITTLGTITTGIWHGTAIADTYISSSSTWNGKASGPGTSTATAVAVYSNTSGNTLLNTGVLIDSSNNITGVANLTSSGTLYVNAGGSPSGTVQVGSTGSSGTYRHVINGQSSWFGIYDSSNSIFFGISTELPAPSGTATLGGYYHGLGIGGSSSGSGTAIFGVLNSGQGGNGKGSTAFTIYDNNIVYTYNNTLDDGSGNAAFSGNISNGTWNGSVIGSAYGGTGVNNGSKTITLGGNLTTSGAYTITLTATAATTITLPTSGTLVSTTVTTLSSLVSVGTITTGTWNGTTIAVANGGTGAVTLTGLVKGNGTSAFTAAVAGTDYLAATGGSSVTTLGTITSGTWNASIITGTYGGTGVNNGSNTLTLAGNLATSGAFAVTLTATGTTNITLPTSGTLISSTVTTLSSLVSVGTLTTGTWNASIITGTYGGTGVNNGTNTLTLAGNLVTSGAYSITLTATAATNVTLPTSGTLVNTSVATLSSLASVGTITTGTWNASVVTGTYGGTGVNNGSKTITLGGNLTTSGAYSITLTATATTSITLPTSGTLVTTTGTQTITNTFITPRTASTTSSATPTPACNTTDLYILTALAATATFGAPTGTPVEGQKLMIRILDNGTAQTLAWNAAYRAGTDLPLPTTTVVSKTLYLGFVYNSENSTWDYVSQVGNM